MKLDDDILLVRRPAHSDYLVHWTGRDLFDGLDPGAVEYSDELVEKTLERVRKTLRYGLWLTRPRDNDTIRLRSGDIRKPDIPRVCFTELRVSDSSLHARKFGPIGFGVKRPFVMMRLGGPVYYVVNYPWDSLFQELLVELADPASPHHHLGCFFKGMVAGRNKLRLLEYDLYEESEWRIVCTDRLLVDNAGLLGRRLRVPSEPVLEEIAPLGKGPAYLAPLDAWFSLMIYPNLQIKNAAGKDAEIRALMAAIKDGSDPLVEVEDERFNSVVELDFGTIKNL